jgi:hypothetical protein
MDILSDYRITALLVSERDLALRAERVRIADERTQLRARRLAVVSTTATGSICVPSASH